LPVKNTGKGGGRSF